MEFKFARTAKIGGFNTFSKLKSRGGEYRVSHGSPLKMSSTARLYGVTYVKLKISRRSSEPTGRKNTKF